MFLPKHWPASVLVQVGQAGDGVPIIDPANVAATVAFPSFADEVASASGFADATDKRAVLIRQTLSAEVEKGTNFVQIGVNGYSPNDAQNAIKAALSILIKTHDSLIEPHVQQKKQILAESENSLNMLQKQQAVILGTLTSASASQQSKFSENIVLSNLQKANESEIRSLKEKIAALQEQLSQSKTFSTKAAVPIYVSPTPDWGSKRFYVTWGAFIGLVCGFAWLVLNDRQFRASAYDRLFGQPEAV